MSDINQSNSLIDLAARIKAEHEACTAALRSGLKYAIAAEDLLIEAKSHLEHGAWLPWLKEYCAVSERTARLYMRLAANRDQIEAISATVADLSIRGAIALLAAPKKTSPVVGLAHMAADALVDELDLVAFEEAQTQHMIGETPANVAAHDLLGDQLVSAITECRSRLVAASDVPLDPGLDATTAILRAKDLAAEILRRVEGSQ